VESIAIRFASLFLLVVTAAGWFFVTKWIVGAILGIADEVRLSKADAAARELEDSLQETSDDADKPVIFGEADEDTDNDRAYKEKPRDDEIGGGIPDAPSDDTLRRRIYTLARFYSLAWFGIFITFAAALLAVLNVLIAIPLVLIGILAVMAQISCGAFSIFSSWYPSGHPVNRLLRRAFIVALVLGIAYPVLVLVIARVVISLHNG